MVASELVQLGLCQTWSETTKFDFLVSQLNSDLRACFSVVVSFLLADQCPDCHWNGRCNTHTGKCHCYEGFKGVDCTTDCGCQGHGHCKPGNALRKLANVIYRIFSASKIENVRMIGTILIF